MSLGCYGGLGVLLQTEGSGENMLILRSLGECFPRLFLTTSIGNQTFSFLSVEGLCYSIRQRVVSGNTWLIMKVNLGDVKRNDVPCSHGTNCG